MKVKLSNPSKDRKRMLIQLAIIALENIEEFGDELTLVYDDAECDISCLGEDLRIEFDFEDDDLIFED